MTWLQTLPLLAVLSSLIPGLIIFSLGEDRRRLRTTLNLSGAFVKLGLIGFLTWAVFTERDVTARYEILPGLEFMLGADALSVIFCSLSALLWFVTTIYAIGYLEDSPNRSRFFGFFSLCVSATTGIALSGNLFTFLIFYELLTLSTYPLVVHRGTRESLAAGRVYLLYTVAGGGLLLLGTAWLTAVAGSVEFAATGVLSSSGVDHTTLVIIFALLVAGIGVKAAVVPLHGWLPRAMVAPAPVSALLHAVAVVKAGAFGIVRVVYDVYGVEFAGELGLLFPLAVVAAITILYGSVRALSQDELKKRLAYSTVSQVSYILLGVAVLGPFASIGGLSHLVHQGLMKITLFFCAGNLAETHGIHRISEMNGLGRRMPWTMGAFTVGAFGMIGVPPIAGFFSKWYLGLGSLEADMPWVLAVLVGSTVLNGAYFLPILHRVWFRELDPSRVDANRGEAPPLLLAPALITGGLSLLVGVLAGSPWSPLSWARLIAAREYLP